MNKRELIHALVDRLLDLEASSNKMISFNYSHHSMSFYVARNHLAYRDWLTKTSVHVFFSDDSGRTATQFIGALDEINRVASLPDSPVEKMVDVQLPESKAKELGLIENQEIA
jgi:hypothetical protein